MVRFMIGADPECFVGNATGVKSIIGKIGGTKKDPLPLPIGDGFAVQEDNVALEFNIPASASRRDFVANITRATSFLEQTMRDMHGLHFFKTSAEYFPEEELLDPAALVFGCDPDYNAWTGTVNPRPSSPDKTLRSCGGHIHIGNKQVTPIKGTQACDLFLGVPSVLMDNGSLRKSLYGQPGAYRKKPFGFEYRVLSNFWIFDEKLIEWAYDNTARALSFVLDGGEPTDDRDDIIKCISTNDVVLAKKLIDKYDLEVVHA